MSKNAKSMPVPPMPFPFPGKKDDEKKKIDFKTEFDNFEANMDSFFGQIKDMQKSAMDASKKQWNTFFAQCIEMQQSFADSLPEEMPFFVPVDPKDIIKKDKELRVMANKKAIEGADAFFDFMLQTQKYTKDVVSEGVKNVENKIEEKKAEEKKAEKKEAPAKKAAPKKNAEAKVEEMKEADDAQI